MKGFVKFLLGVVVGFILCLGLLYFIGNRSNGNGLTMFDEPGESISTKSFKVVQVDAGGNALAMEKSGYGENTYLGMVVLFLAEEGKSYYDDQVITIPSGMCARQLGTYRYLSNGGELKTVPAVAIRKK